MSSSKKAIWISFDFGLKGDYTGLYTWLDNNKALECGQNLAYCNYDISKLSYSNTEEVIKHISKELKKNIKLSKTDRLYIIWKDSDNRKVKGEFISGGRKQSPWEGYGQLDKDSATDTAD